MQRSTVAAAFGVSLARVAFVLGAAGPLAPADEATPLDGKQLPEGGSLSPRDAALIPDAAGLPDALTPPMLLDGSIPKPRPLQRSR